MSQFEQGDPNIQQRRTAAPQAGSIQNNVGLTAPGLATAPPDFSDANRLKQLGNIVQGVGVGAIAIKKKREADEERKAVDARGDAADMEAGLQEEFRQGVVSGDIEVPRDVDPDLFAREWIKGKVGSENHEAFDKRLEDSLLPRLSGFIFNEDVRLQADEDKSTIAKAANSIAGLADGREATFEETVKAVVAETSLEEDDVRRFLTNNSLESAVIDGNQAAFDAAVGTAPSDFDNNVIKKHELTLKRNIHNAEVATKNAGIDAVNDIKTAANDPSQSLSTRDIVDAADAQLEAGVITKEENSELRRFAVDRQDRQVAGLELAESALQKQIEHDATETVFRYVNNGDYSLAQQELAGAVGDGTISQEQGDLINQKIISRAASDNAEKTKQLNAALEQQATGQAMQLADQRASEGEDLLQWSKGKTTWLDSDGNESSIQNQDLVNQLLPAWRAAAEDFPSYAAMLRETRIADPLVEANITGAFERMAKFEPGDEVEDSVVEAAQQYYTMRNLSPQLANNHSSDEASTFYEAAEFLYSDGKGNLTFKQALSQARLNADNPPITVLRKSVEDALGEEFAAEFANAPQITNAVWRDAGRWATLQDTSAERGTEKAIRMMERNYISNGDRLTFVNIRSLPKPSAERVNHWLTTYGRFALDKSINKDFYESDDIYVRNVGEQYVTYSGGNDLTITSTPNLPVEFPIDILSENDIVQFSGMVDQAEAYVGLIQNRADLKEKGGKTDLRENIGRGLFNLAEMAITGQEEPNENLGNLLFGEQKTEEFHEGFVPKREDFEFDPATKQYLLDNPEMQPLFEFTRNAILSAQTSQERSSARFRKAIGGLSNISLTP